jgi:hypothetical protein
MSAGEPERQARRGWKRLLPRDPWQLLIAPIILAVFGAGLAYLTRDRPEKKTVALEALPAVVINPREDFDFVMVASGPNKGQQASRPTDRSKPRIEIRLHNAGTRRTVLTSARFAVRRFAVIPGCGRGSGLELSASYDVTLPDRAGAAVEVPIDQQLGPDEADRFAFRLTAAHRDDRHAAQDLFYELDVSVRHDNDPEPLKVDRVVVALPGAPIAQDARFFSVPGTRSCSRTPPRQQLVATTFAGTRSAELDAFLDALRAAGRRSATT